MKILKNKTYKNLLLKIDVLESDKVKLQKKCDEIQIKLDSANDVYEIQRNVITELKNEKIKIQANLDDQTDYISSLNERLQNSETQAKNTLILFEASKKQNILLRSEIDELQSKLSRKGLGKKGSKK